MKKTCNICKKEKDIDEFAKDRTKPSGYGYTCLFCKREKSKKAHNELPIEDRRAKGREKWEKHCRTHWHCESPITREEYYQQAEKQNYQCAICGIQADKKCLRKILHADHCHATNKARGLLCSKCNRGIGLLEDNVSIMQKAIEYIKEYTNDTGGKG